MMACRSQAETGASPFPSWETTIHHIPPKEEITMTTYTLALAITGIVSLSTGFMRLLSRLEGDRR